MAKRSAPKQSIDYGLPKEGEVRCEVCTRLVEGRRTWFVFRTQYQVVDGQIRKIRAKLRVCARCLSLFRSIDTEPLVSDGERGRVLLFRRRYSKDDNWSNEGSDM